MSDIRKVNVDFSNFDLSHTHKTTMDMGKLVPIACIPTLPGDKIEVDVSAFVRGMPTVAPIMDKVDIKINHFYVPYRILWDYFPEFISNSEKYKFRENGKKPTMPVMDTKPFVDVFKSYFKTSRKSNKSFTSKLPENYIERYPLGKLCNYLGIVPIHYEAPKGENEELAKENAKKHKDLISLMPLLAYNKIFLDYYIPQRWLNFAANNLTSHWLSRLATMLEEVKRSSNYVMDKHDRGYNVSVDLFWRNDGSRLFGYDQSLVNYQPGYYSTINSFFALKNVYWNHDYFSSALPEPTLHGDVKIPTMTQSDELNPDGSKVAPEEGATIRDLRKAISLQHYLESLSQGGGRYLETMEIMFNQHLPDDMLQYSEYLGGSVVPLFVNEVEQTSPYESSTGVKSYLGDLSGKPVGAGDTENIRFEADEYGIYMCLAHIVPKKSYMNPVNRSWRELELLDFPNPLFEGIGDQAVYSYELGFDTTKDAYKVWGYVPRYAHYKTHLDRFSGEMQGTLSHWHLGDIQKGHPTIDPNSIECLPRTDIFNVPDESDKFLATFKIDVKAVRPLSYNSPLGIGRI